MKKLIGQKWLHFFLIGFVFYLGKPFLSSDDNEAKFKPVVYGPDQARIKQIEDFWWEKTRTHPNDQTMAALLNREINNELLFQEALSRNYHLNDQIVHRRLVENARYLHNDSDNNLTEADLFAEALTLRLHLNDPVVKRRLVQLMKLHAYKQIPVKEPSPQELVQQYGEEEPTIQLQALDIQHIFFSRDLRNTPEQDSTKALTQLRLQSLAPAETSLKGDLFLNGSEFFNVTTKQIAKHFGHHFAQQLLNQINQTPPLAKEWYGPIESTYGFHLVWVDAITQQSLDIQSNQRYLLGKWKKAQEAQALETFISKLREKYQIVFPAIQPQENQNLTG